MDRSHSRDDISPGSRLLFWVAGSRSTSLDPFLFQVTAPSFAFFCMAASRSDVIAFVNAIRVTLGSCQEHFFTDAQVPVSVSWLHNPAFLEDGPFNVRCRAEVLRPGVLGKGGIVLPAFSSEGMRMLVKSCLEHFG